MNIVDSIQNHEFPLQPVKLRALLLIGAPGSGKGTQGRALGALPRFFHCSCGDVFRSVDCGTQLGREFIEYSKQGKLMPDDLTIKIWQAHIREISRCGKYNPATDYLVLDGIPRNAAQARMMDPFLDVRLVINLRCSCRQPLIERIQKRAFREKRLDDANEAVINRRLDIYETESHQLIGHYPAHKVHSLDAMWRPLLILREILGRIATSEPRADLIFDEQEANAGAEVLKQ